MQERNYARRAWVLLTQGKGWIKPVLVMAVAMFVPIAGALGVTGYALEWARLTAWGIDASPKQKDVQVGACIRSGWRACVVGLGWGLCLALVLGIVNAVVAVIPGILGNLTQALLTIALCVLELLLMVAVTVASIRTAIYERIGAGFRLDRIWEMIKRDTKGFTQLVLFTLAWSIIMVIICFIILLVIGLAFVPVVISSSYSSSEYAMMMALSQTIGIVIVLAVVFGYGFSVFMCGYTLVFYNAVALWMRQFDVPSWGRSEDPLPDAVFDSHGTEKPQQPGVPWESEVSRRTDSRTSERPRDTWQDSVSQTWEEHQSVTDEVQLESSEQKTGPALVVEANPELTAESMTEFGPQAGPALVEDPEETFGTTAGEWTVANVESVQPSGEELLQEERLQSAQEDEPVPEPDAADPTIRLTPAPTQRLDRNVSDATGEATAGATTAEDHYGLASDTSDVDDLYNQLYDVMHRDE